MQNNWERDIDKIREEAKTWNDKVQKYNQIYINKYHKDPYKYELREYVQVKHVKTTKLMSLWD